MGYSHIWHYQQRQNNDIQQSFKTNYENYFAGGGAIFNVFNFKIFIAVQFLSGKNTQSCPCST